METVQVKIYEFAELSDEAKETAREWWRAGADFPWSDEYRQSIETFCAEFGVRLLDWRIDPFGSFDYSHDASNSNFRGLKLRSFDREAMPTGFCADCDLRYAFADEWTRTGDPLAAFNAALDAGFKAWREDWEYQYSNEGTDEAIICNEYRITESGKFWRA